MVSDGEVFGVIVTVTSSKEEEKAIILSPPVKCLEF